MPADVHNLAEVERYVKEETNVSKRDADSDSDQDQDHSNKRKASAPPSPSVSPPSGESGAASPLQGASLQAALSSAQNTSGLVLTAEQQQQILQYAHANGQQDLAATLANAMVSPISLPGNLNSTLLQTLQAANVITSLPGPPHLPSMDGSTRGQVNGEDDAEAQRKRANHPRGLTDDERRQRRLLRNRMAAKECRKKKKHYVQSMEESIIQLEDDNRRLRKELVEAHAKLALGSMQEGSEGYRLMKEVEELNAKLGHQGLHGLQFIQGVGQQLGELAQSQATENPSSSNASDASST